MCSFFLSNQGASKFLLEFSPLKTFENSIFCKFFEIRHTVSVAKNRTLRIFEKENFSSQISKPLDTIEQKIINIHRRFDVNVLQFFDKF